MFILTFKEGTVTIQVLSPGMSIIGDRLVGTIPDLGETLWDYGIDEDLINDTIDRLEGGLEEATLLIPQP